MDKEGSSQNGALSTSSSTVVNEQSPLLKSSPQREPEQEPTQRPYRRNNSNDSLQSGLALPAALPGMRIRCHLLLRDPDDTKNALKECTPQEALTGAAAGGQHGHHYWVDIVNYQANHYLLKDWWRQIHLPHFVLEVLSEAPEAWASQVVPLQKACLLVLRILPSNPQSDDMAHVAALSLRNMLITFTSSTTLEASPYYPDSDKSTEDNDADDLYQLSFCHLNEAERLPRPTSPGALVAWLRFHLERTSRATRNLRRGVLEMDQAMDRDILSVPLDELIAAKDQLLKVLSVAEEQSECIDSLSAVTLHPTPHTHNNHNTSTNNGDPIGQQDGPNFNVSSLKGSLASLVATAGATERMALRLEKHLGDLRKRSEQYDHSVMNRRLAVLTVLSAIFLPLTLLTGIWGMNFQQSK